MSAPLVTIALPVLNAADTLGYALRSLEWQTFADWELLILDDGSSDGSADVARSFAEREPRARIVAPTGERGLAARLNQAVDMAAGAYLARMDADDVAYPERLERQVDLLERRQDIDVVGSSTLVFRAGGVPIGVRTVPETHEAICGRPHSGFALFHPTWVARTHWLRRLGYDVRAIRAEDQELLLRAYRTSTFANVPDVLLGYREDALSLDASLRGRRSLIRAGARTALARGDVLGAMLTAGSQAAKGIVDVAAMGTGMGATLQRRRGHAHVEPAQFASWRLLWSRLQESAA